MFYVLKELVRDGEQQEIASAETQQAAVTIATQEAQGQTDCRVIIERRDGSITQMVAAFDPLAPTE